MTTDLISIPGGEDLPINPMVGIGAIALNMAINYLDMTVVKDGQLYQQLKIEGKEIKGVSLETAFHYAKQIERHLMGTSDRIAGIVLDAISHGIASDEEGNQPVGEFIEALIIDLGFDRKHAARTIDVPEEDFAKLLDGEIPLSPEMAAKLEEHFKMPADELMNIQDEYLKKQALKDPVE
jgi:plasmid maintenance system antidote protein VapI